MVQVDDQGVSKRAGPGPCATGVEVRRGNTAVVIAIDHHDRAALLALDPQTSGAVLPPHAVESRSPSPRVNLPPDEPHPWLSRPFLATPFPLVPRWGVLPLAEVAHGRSRLSDASGLLGQDR